MSAPALQINTDAATTTGSFARRRRWLSMSLVAVVLADVAIAAFVHWRLEHLTRARAEAQLEAQVRDAFITNTEWLAVRERRLDVMTRESSLRAHLLAALAHPHEPKAIDDLRADGEGITVGGARVPWLLLAADGTPVLDEGVGALTDEAKAVVQAAKGSFVTLPMDLGARGLRGLGVVPLGQGALVVLLDPDGYTASGPLQAHRVFDTGELYAVDASGLMLSQSRFTPALRAAGLLGPNDDSSVRKLELRDPLVDLTSGARPEQLRSALPFTHAATELMAGRDGHQAAGYRDYRGVRVLGAWAWDGVHHYGLVAELDEAEALEPVAVVRPLLLALVVALGLVVAAGAWLWLRLRAAEARAAKLLAEANRLGQYELVRKLGEGGMGVVYEGRHALLQRPAAIKVMQKGTLNDEQVARFEREARATAALGHPNTISLYDFGQARDGSFYYVMELLRGADLDQLVERTGADARRARRLHPASALRLARRSARAGPRAPRHEALERLHDRAARRVRRGEGARLRVGAHHARWRHRRDPAQPHHGHAALHGARDLRGSRPRHAGE